MFERSPIETVSIRLSRLPIYRVRSAAGSTLRNGMVLLALLRLQNSFNPLVAAIRPPLAQPITLLSADKHIASGLIQLNEEQGR
jgi:hypothetical protein